MLHHISQFFKNLMGNENYAMETYQKRELEKYITKEQQKVEKLISVIGFFISLSILGITFITGMLVKGTNIESFVASLLIYSLMPAYFLIIYFIQKKDAYVPSIKYITPFIFTTIVSLFLLVYSVYIGWIFVLYNTAVTHYFLIIIFTGLYQNPRVSFYTVSVVIIEYIAVWVYASIAYQGLSVSALSHSLVSTASNYFIMGYGPLFLVCGIITILITRRMDSVRSRALFLESESVKKEVEHKAIDLRSKQRIDSFVSLAHDVKTPLTIIGNYLDNLVSLEGSSKECEAVERNFQKLRNDIEQLLDAEKLERHVGIYDHGRSTDLSKLLADRMGMFEELALVKKIGFSHSIDPDLSARIDPFAAVRVINNLVENAIKYTHENGWIRVSAVSNAEQIQLSVEDNGIGIPETEIERIFEPYTSISTDTRHAQGLGLGLSIVKKIAEEVNGNIKVESKVDAGSKFTITLARERSTGAPLPSDYIPLSDYKDPEQTTVETKVSGTRRKPVILLVDDNRELLAFMHENLSYGYSVYYALNGKEAIEKLARIPLPDIIVSDIMMDTMDGYELKSRLSESAEYAGIPFVFLTARTPVHDQVKGLSLGAIDYITKPFHTDVLAKKIESILRLKNEQRESDIVDMEKKISTLLRVDTRGEIDRSALDVNFDKYKLTAREKDIAIRLLKGLENKEVGATLDISSNTVKEHIRNIYKKCEVQNRVEFVNLINKGRI
jgi:signal transduction histidine kinase/DNA-binding NarL/FixJ family response regulator